MARWTDWGNIWATLKELDVRPLVEEAEQPFVLALVGAPQAGKSSLLAALCKDERNQSHVLAPVIEVGLDQATRADGADLIILVLDATRDDFTREAQLVAEWQRARRNLIIFYNKMDAVPEAQRVRLSTHAWAGAPVARGSVYEPQSLTNSFIPCVMERVKERRLALARQYPLFRLAVARAWIRETALANASYALGSGMAGIVPALNVPFNVADMLVLTKNQALMVYKLVLALGLSTSWQEHIVELGSVVGVGFVWRQIARQLVGLIPVWGIVPKVAVAYAGTYAVGEAVVYWYYTGHKLSGQKMREVYADALARGKQVAQEIATQATFRLPRVSLPRLSLPARRRRPPRSDQSR